MSITRNFLYNSAITVSTYLIGLVIFPYMTRVLGVDNIGVIGFVDNTINYFVIALTLGANSVGIREIAACQGDKKKCTEVFFSIMSFLLITTVIACTIYTIVIFSIPQFNQYKDYFLIGYIKLLFTPLVIEWLFAGSQDFEYISKRTIIVRLLYAISIWIFVKQKDDVSIYFLLTGLMTVTNSFINIRYARKYIDFKGYVFDAKRFFLPIAKLGLFQIIISFYSTFNYIYLRWVSTEHEVGLYYTSVQIYSVIVGLYSAYSNVVMPRMSELIKQGDTSEAKQLIGKSFNALFSLGIPIVAVVLLFAPLIIRIIAGAGFEDSVAPLMVVMPVLIIAGINQINGTQVLMPLHKDNVLLITASMAAIVGLLGNILFDSKIGALGAALTVLLSESTGCISGYIYSLRKGLFRFPIKELAKNILFTIPYFCLFGVVYLITDNEVIKYGVATFLFIIYFVISQYLVLKNPIVVSIVDRCFINKPRTKNPYQ